MTKHILSYGGGVNSSALFFYLLDKKMPLDLVIFADTGEELPETYDAVARMRKLCKDAGVEFKRVQSEKGNLYDYYFNKKAVMSLMRRDCTSKFKISPIRKYIRERYGKQEKFIFYIGIAWDEWHRVRKSDVNYIENKFPFVDDKVGRDGNLEILKAHNFQAIKSGCKGCIYLKKSSWVRMLLEDPDEFDRHMKLEENNSGFPKVLLNGRYPLRKLKETYKAQQSLSAFEDSEASCQAINGGCFL